MGSKRQRTKRPYDKNGLIRLGGYDPFYHSPIILDARHKWNIINIEKLTSEWFEVLYKCKCCGIQKTNTEYIEEKQKYVRGISIENLTHG